MCIKMINGVPTDQSIKSILNGGSAPTGSVRDSATSDQLKSNYVKPFAGINTSLLGRTASPRDPFFERFA